MKRALAVVVAAALAGCAGAVVQHETPVVHPRPATLTGEVPPITIRDARRGVGATVAYDPAAHADAEKQVRAFLRRHLMR